MSTRSTASRAYRMPATAMINITFGERKSNKHGNQRPLMSANGTTTQHQQQRSNGFVARGGYNSPRNQRSQQVKPP